MRPLRLKQLENLEQVHAREPRTHFLWVEASDTTADIEEQRHRLIAAGRAEATDRFIAMGWK